ncbi:hypothetical protein [Corynebacterium macginleyi]|uniref:hypothetical protein n=1 Tax=Corynebacterium macginleyi TaxID=38290 RepID=UPI00190CDF9B|nr:hypothetical protein [Corynebacterium macginleyi]MBK4148775.1 hypothetical protein [Corynebacterium macginleyi]MBK4160059.1 hypothetical protein [Corynebacterium macginleyi]MBK4178666.1 hypothetical protein [Corynebacterium macginleyi]
MNKTMILAIALFAAITFFSFAGQAEAAGIVAIISLVTMVFIQVFTLIRKDE